MRPVFADPKTDFVFKKLFGTDAHRDLTIALLNALLELDATHAIVDVTFLREPRTSPPANGKPTTVRLLRNKTPGAH